MVPRTGGQAATTNNNNNKTTSSRPAGSNPNAPAREQATQQHSNER